MIPFSNNIATLADDIHQIIKGAYGEKLEMVRLCKDHNNPLIFYDKKPVLDILQDEFVGIFDLNSKHYFLSPGQAFRIGSYCRLALPNLVAIMLKAEWEGYLAKMSGYMEGSGVKLGSLLCDQNLIEMYITDFNPDTGKYFNMIRDTSYIPKSDITYSHIDFVMGDLLAGKNFLIENEQAGSYYKGNDITEKILLNKIPVQQKESYIRLKELWKLKSAELDDLLLSLERRKRLNMGIENKYFKTFGNLESEKSRFTYMVEKYRVILGIMQDQPELSYRELIKKAVDRLIEADRERYELKNKIARSHNYIGDLISADSQSTVTDEFKNSYMQACKRLLRKLFLLLHTDTCPNYSGLAPQKKTEINKLWLKLMKSTKDELYSFSPTMLLYSLPDYEQLEAIYKKACYILDINPDDFEVGNRLEFMIRKGATLKSILEFLKIETERLELHLAHLELVQNEYTNEDLSQRYRNALANINIHSERLKTEITELKEQIFKLKKEISKIYIRVTG